jgi:hypothetical protein
VGSTAADTVDVVWHIRIISPEAGRDIGRAVRAGNPTAQHLLYVMAATVDVIEAITEPTPDASCLICAATQFYFRCYPHCLVLIALYDDEQSNVAVFGICAACSDRYRSAAEIAAATLDSCRTRVAGMSDLRLLPPLSAPGHA